MDGHLLYDIFLCATAFDLSPRAYSGADSEKNWASSVARKPDDAQQKPGAMKLSKSPAGVESTWRKVRRMCEETEGRDKTMKIIQYCIKLLSWVVKTNNLQFSRANLELLDALAFRFGKTRVVIRLVKFFQKIDVLMVHPFPVSKVLQTGQIDDVIEFIDFVNTGLGMSVDFINDVHFWSVMKFLPEDMHKTIERFLMQLWWFTVVVDICVAIIRLSPILRQIRELEQSLGSENNRLLLCEQDELCESEVSQDRLSKLKEKRIAKALAIMKLFGDLGVATIMAFKVKDVEGMRLSSSLFSGCTSFTSMWRKNVV